jgi:2-methylisocitrate lyase-like PEP mutase family enzyme
MDATARRDRFRALHTSGTFVIPNPFDRGSARMLEAVGATALATTSAGLAFSRGRPDMGIDRTTLLDHVADLAGAVDLPLHVDAERGFATDPGGVADTVHALAEAGASGCSIEDWDPATGRIDPFDEAVLRVAAAAAAARDHGLVLTARCENHLHGIDDLDDTLARLDAYRRVGAEVVYAPALRDLAAIRRVVDEVDAAVNVLLLPGGPTVADLAAAGVRRVSLGGALAHAAYAAALDVARSVLDDGALPPGAGRIPADVAARALRSG